VLPLPRRYKEATKIKPLYLAEPVYGQKVLDATGWLVVISDTATRQHWATDGASATIHLTAAWYASMAGAWDTDTVERTLSNLTIPAEPNTQENPSLAARRTLLSRRSRTLPLDVIASSLPPSTLGIQRQERTETYSEESSESKWVVQHQFERFLTLLEQIRDRHHLPGGSASDGVDFTELSRVLTGFQFRDLIEGGSLIRPVDLKLGHGATDWFRTFNNKQQGAINLLGSNFGDLVKPADPQHNRSCPHSAGPPIGQDSLAMPLYLLTHFVRKQSKHTDACVQLRKNCFWQGADSHFEHCFCRTRSNLKCTALIRRLHKAPLKQTENQAPLWYSPVLQRHSQGAVIFCHEP
jgi:hypothetical protein